MNKPLHIFKTGRHTDVNGRTLSFTEVDLAATAKAYDPALHEAPLVVGHPALDAPAYGWVKSLTFSDAGLEADPDQVDAAFAEMVAAGRFKRVSASFYTPESPANPVPGVYYLRHVGFLGAAAPAVKGLRPVSFGEAEEGVVEFSERDGTKVARALRSLREWIIGKFGSEDADKAMPGWFVEDIAMSDRPGFSEPDNPAGRTAKEEDVDAKEAAALKAENERLAKENLEFAEARKKQQEAEAASAAKENLEFAETLVKEGRLLPSYAPVVVAALAAMRADAVVEFGEGDKKEKKPLAEAFKEMLGKGPKVVEFGEIAGGSGGGGAVSFAAPSGYSVDADRLEIHSKALAFQAAHPSTDYVAAVKAVGGN